MGFRTKEKLRAKLRIEPILFNKALTAILAEYYNYNNIFLVENIAKLVKYTKMNVYTVELKRYKQLLFEHIYSLYPVELEMLKTYIKLY